MRARTTRLKALLVVIGQFSVSAVDAGAHTATSSAGRMVDRSSRGSVSPLPPHRRAAWGLGLAVGGGNAPSQVYDATHGRGARLAGEPASRGLSRRFRCAP